MNIQKKFAAVAVASAMMLAACGSDDSGSDTTMPAEPGTVVDVAVATDGFETLVQAVTAADLVATLSGEGPFTVFAPTDEAFAALPEGLLEKLLLPENKAVLVQILTYHVVAGKVGSADLSAGDVASVEGSNITVAITDGKVSLNGSSNVVIADVAASNGVIHAIDAVILPPGLDVSAL
jgi:uncharacterized surface protein with fasciclin (FAS1) repeats